MKNHTDGLAVTAAELLRTTYVDYRRDAVVATNERYRKAEYPYRMTEGWFRHDVVFDGHTEQMLELTDHFVITADKSIGRLGRYATRTLQLTWRNESEPLMMSYIDVWKDEATFCFPDSLEHHYDVDEVDEVWRSALVGSLQSAIETLRAYPEGLRP